jgi:peptide deformylase
MTVRKIVVLGEPGDAVLREPAKKVRRIDEYTRQLVEELTETVKEAHGAGLAAPQIGVRLRAIVTYVDEVLRVVLNPEIVKESEEEVEGDEGCLSIPGWYGPVVRKESVTVRGLSATGKPTNIKAEGWEARAFQHEIDHLNGILFLDRMDDKSKLHRAEPAEEGSEEEAEQERAAV